MICYDRTECNPACFHCFFGQLQTNCFGSLRFGLVFVQGPVYTKPVSRVGHLKYLPCVKFILRGHLHNYRFQIFMRFGLVFT